MEGAATTILLVEDDAKIRTELRRALEAEGFAVVEADTKQAVFDCIKRYPVALLTLEIGIGDSNGLNLTREIRSRINIPIFITTSRRTPLDRLALLENGADDYVTKPFHIKEVVMRIRALLRRYGSDIRAPIAPDVFPFQDCILDMRRRELRRNGDIVELTEIELKLLELFLRHPARVLSRDEINHALRGHEWSPSDRTIDGHISRLRRKLEPARDESQSQLIKSVRGIGYVFYG